MQATLFREQQPKLEADHVYQGKDLIWRGDLSHISGRHQNI
jgi:hypothetical protein